MAFSQDSAAVNATPVAAEAAAAAPYHGNPITARALDTKVEITLTGVRGLENNDRVGEHFDAVRVGYYTAAQGRGNALFSPQVVVDGSVSAPQNFVIVVAGLTNGTAYTFFAQGVY